MELDILKMQITISFSKHYLKRYTLINKKPEALFLGGAVEGGLLRGLWDLSSLSRD